MKLTYRSEYALLALLYLARVKPEIYASGDEIASAQKIPKRFLQQILHTLKRSRLIKSSKGKGGGYALAKPAKEISLAEVVRLLDGPLAPTSSVSKYFYEPSPIEREEAIVSVLKDIRHIVAKRLEETTLFDVA